MDAPFSEAAPNMEHSPDGSAWQVEPADIHIVDTEGTVAVSTLGSPELAATIASRSPAGLAAVGPTATENIGIEKLIRNVQSHPAIRVLLVAGPDTGGTAPTGHFAGDALVCLHNNGIKYSTRRIIGARGRRPVLRNLDHSEIERFRAQVHLIDRREEEDCETLLRLVANAAAGKAGTLGIDGAKRPPGGIEGPPPGGGKLLAADVVEATGAPLYRADPSGYFLIFADHENRRLVLEHYGPDGTRDLIAVGTAPQAIATEVIERNLVSRLDHAAYLGGELERASRALAEGISYVQDDPTFGSSSRRNAGTIRNGGSL